MCNINVGELEICVMWVLTHRTDLTGGSRPALPVLPLQDAAPSGQDHYPLSP